MVYWFTRVTAIIAIIFIAAFTIALPLVYVKRADLGWQLRPILGVAYVLLALTPHRFIIHSTLRYRFVMACFLASFFIFLSPEVFIQAVLIPVPVALMASRFKATTEYFTKRKRNGVE